MALREEILHQQPDEASHTSTLKEQVLSFRLAEKTPLEAMMFVQRLQEILRHETDR